MSDFQEAVEKAIQAEFAGESQEEETSSLKQDEEVAEEVTPQPAIVTGKPLILI